jgi:putative ABC transport system permease protein
MFDYYLRLALASLRRNLAMTTLLVVAIGMGIGASMSLITVLHVMSGDPIPGLSAHLYVPHLDPRPLAAQKAVYGDASDNLTYIDAMALLKARRATRQAAMAGGLVLMRDTPDSPAFKPSYVASRYVTADFFPMFHVPIHIGRALDDNDIAGHARVAVIDEVLAHRLFGDADPLGRTLRFEHDAFTIVGTTAGWRPQPLFYNDIGGRGMFGDPDLVMLPLTTALDLDLSVNNTACWADPDHGANPHLGGECSWLQFWVQLDDDRAASGYRDFLANYWREQKATGRFERKEAARLYRLDAWMDHAHLAPGDLQLQLRLALGFLAVCLLNIVALLMAKFLRRSAEISIRRALGARRTDIFVQLATEALLIGMGGGLLGLAVTAGGLWSIRQRPDAYAHLAHLDASMLLATLALAVGSAVLAGLLPAWRACHVPPAMQLKIN